MLRDMGFAHAIAKAVLEDNPKDAEALKILVRPENRIVLEDGTEIDLSGIDEEKAIREELKRKMATFKIFVSV
jgi:hypothetical protein